MPFIQRMINISNIQMFLLPRVLSTKSSYCLKNKTMNVLINLNKWFRQVEK